MFINGDDNWTKLMNDAVVTYNNNSLTLKSLTLGIQKKITLRSVEKQLSVLLLNYK